MLQMFYFWIYFCNEMDMLTTEEQMLITQYRELSTLKRIAVRLFLNTGKANLALRFCCHVVSEHMHNISGVLTTESR